MTARNSPTAIVFVGPLAPPVQGAAVINETLQRMLRSKAEVLVADVSNRTARGWRKHWVRSWAYLRAYGLIARRPRARKVIHVEGSAGITYQYLIASLAYWQPQKFLFYHHTSDAIFRRSWRFVPFFRLTSESCHVFCSDAMPVAIRRNYGVAVAACIVNNFAFVRSMHSTLPGEPRSDLASGPNVSIGFIGSVNFDKGIGAFLDVCRSLRERGVRFTATVAGSVSDAEVSAALERARGELSVTPVGVVEGKQKEVFLDSLDALLFPSRYRFETQSLVVPEALSRGIPVIAIDHALVREVCPAGMCVSADEYVQFAADTIQCLGPSRAALLSRAAYEFAANTREIAEAQLDELVSKLAPARLGLRPGMDDTSHHFGAAE